MGEAMQPQQKMTSTPEDGASTARHRFGGCDELVTALYCSFANVATLHQKLQSNRSTAGQASAIRWATCATIPDGSLTLRLQTIDTIAVLQIMQRLPQHLGGHALVPPCKTQMRTGGIGCLARAASTQRMQQAGAADCCAALKQSARLPPCTLLHKPPSPTHSPHLHTGPSTLRRAAALGTRPHALFNNGQQMQGMCDA